MEIRSAKIEESGILTSISFASKKYWAYPESFFETWKNELTISPDYILQNRVFVFEDRAGIAGYYAMVYLENDMDVSGTVLSKGHWLEHMFILPAFIGKGIGTKLFEHLKIICRQNRINTISILSDPNAKGFYEKMGCRYVKEYPSSIPHRTTPLLVIESQKK
jgi:GNAT superfamily N-acetyltransferase